TSEIIKELKTNDKSEEKSKDQCKKRVLDDEDLATIRKITFVFKLFLYMSYSNPDEIKKSKFDEIRSEYIRP
ncbi:hypothetical protein MUO98_02305, partial [Candidatus Bathyarchaeota archaeon]|nr:hypothetical protein [Candidatus Bathyarchaeota archaeon]